MPGATPVGPWVTVRAPPGVNTYTQMERGQSDVLAKGCRAHAHNSETNRTLSIISVLAWSGVSKVAIHNLCSGTDRYDRCWVDATTGSWFQDVGVFFSLKGKVDFQIARYTFCIRSLTHGITFMVFGLFLLCLGWTLSAQQFSKTEQHAEQWLRSQCGMGHQNDPLFTFTAPSWIWTVMFLMCCHTMVLYFWPNEKRPKHISCLNTPLERK